MGVLGSVYDGVVYDDEVVVVVVVVVGGYMDIGYIGYYASYINTYYYPPIFPSLPILASPAYLPALPII